MAWDDGRMREFPEVEKHSQRDCAINSRKLQSADR
jgi:hypothetical protein